MALFIEIKAADGMVSRTRLEAGANRFSVRLGDSYRILDDQTRLTPEGIAVKRVDNNLIVDGLDKSGTSVEFPEFYNVCSAGSPCELTIENGAGGAPVSITPATQPIGALSDGAFVLYDPNFADNAPPVPSLGDGTIVRNVLYGVGGLAVIGLAAGGGGGGGGDGGDTGVRPDGQLKMTSSQFVNSRTPTITGEGEPGSRVTLRIDTDGDGNPNVTYGTTVGSDSLWSVNLATAVPDSGALPAGGLPDASNVGISSTTSAGNASLPTFVLAYDGTPPPAAALDAVTGDGVVNAGEKQNGFVISGSAEANSTVVLSVGAQVLATVVAGADGRWQTTSLQGAAVPADGDQQLSAVVIDRAGNQSPTTNVSLRIDTTPPALQGLAIGEGRDSTVGINDAGNVGFSGTTEAGASVVVDWNGIVKPVVAGGGGIWSVAYTGAEVPSPPAATGANIPYSITATDVAGNLSVLPGAVLVDRVAPGAPTISPVTGDNLVTQGERSIGVSVSGTAEAGAAVSVGWGSSTRTTTATGGNWQVSFDSGSIPAVASPSGPTTITATAVDGVGNTGASSQQTVTVEAPYPAPTINAVTGDNLVNAADRAGSITLSGTIPLGATGMNIEWGSNYAAAAVISNGTWSAVVPAANIPGDGPSTVVVVITGVGGGSFARQAVTVDTIPPTTPTDALVDVAGADDSISGIDLIAGFSVQGLAGSTDAGAGVSVQLGTRPVQTTTADGTGAWSIGGFDSRHVSESTSPVQLTVTVSDAAGNASIFTDAIVVETAQTGIFPGATPAAAGEVASSAYAGNSSLSLIVDSLISDDLNSSGRLA